MAITESDHMTPPEVTTLRRQADGFMADVQAMTISDNDAYVRAGELVRGIVGYMKRVGEVLDPICAAAHHAHKVAVQQRDDLLKPAQHAREVLGKRMAQWDEAQARFRREAEQAAQRERERLEREAAEQAAAEQRRIQRDAETRRLEEAAALEAKGDKVGAEQLIDAPISVPKVTPAPVFIPRPMPEAAPKLEGVSYSVVWDFEITDPALIPREYLLVNDKAIRQVCKALKEKTNIPGIKAVSRRTSSVKA